MAHNAARGKAMSTKLAYQKRAVDCAARASSATSDHARDIWREMERYWRRRAERDEAPLVPDQSPPHEDEKAR